MAEGYTPIEHEQPGKKVSSVSACERDSEDFPMSWEIQYARGMPLSAVVTTREFLTEFSGTEELVDVRNPHR